MDLVFLCWNRHLYISLFLCTTLFAGDLLLLSHLAFWWVTIKIVHNADVEQLKDSSIYVNQYSKMNNDNGVFLVGAKKAPLVAAWW